MFSVNIQGNNIYFQDIKKEHLPLLLKWYNKVDEFKYATGVDEPIGLDRLAAKYLEVAISYKQFFVAIYLKDSREMIGILKGSIKYEDRNTAWISSLAIDVSHQRKGFGREACNLLEQFLSCNADINRLYLAVIEQNTVGRLFWESRNFKEVRRMKNYITFQNCPQNVIIMSKEIKCKPEKN